MFSLPRRLSPPLVAAAFAVYALVLMWNTVQSQAQLRQAADARLVADSKRRATALGEQLSQRRDAVVELAAVHELQVFLTNRALGMSPRYGLDASLGALEQRLRQAVDKDKGVAAAAPTRVVFIDADGRPLADTAVDGEPAPLPAQGAGLHPGLALDLARKAIVATAPVTFKDRFQGTMLAYSDIGRLYHSLIQLDDDGNYSETLLTLGGQEITPGDRRPALNKVLAQALARMPADRPTPLSLSLIHI